MSSPQRQAKLLKKQRALMMSGGSLRYTAPRHIDPYRVLQAAKRGNPTAARMVFHHVMMAGGHNA